MAKDVLAAVSAVESIVAVLVVNIWSRQGFRVLIYSDNNLIAAPSLEAIKLHLNLTFHLLISLKFQINKLKEINHHPTACSMSFRDSWEATKSSVITNLKLEFNYKVEENRKDMNYHYGNIYGAVYE